MMRTNLFFMMQENSHVILFTSSTSGEGKSFSSSNLAVSYALLGKKVILCGLDIRKPAVGRQFGLPERNKGISILLAKDVVTKEDVESQVLPSGVDEHLDLLLAGSIPPNPTELLARDTMRQILEILKDSYDYVILDTAPVGLVTDTLQISKLVDATVFVCRANYTPKYAIAELNVLVEEKKMNNPCVVLNGCRLEDLKNGGIVENRY
jgi:capsular exopolysaccharide synthesis family protein